MSNDVQRGQRRRHRRRNYARDRKRLQEYTECVICLDERRDDTNRLFCCRKFVHELCMREWFTTGRAGFICPHCKQPQIPLSLHDPLPPYIAPRHYVFRFLTVHFNSHDYFDELRLRWEQPPVPQPPPGWAHFRHFHPDGSGS